MFGLGIIYLEGNLFVITAMVSLVRDSVFAHGDGRRDPCSSTRQKEQAPLVWVSETAHEPGAAPRNRDPRVDSSVRYRHVVEIPPGLPADASRCRRRVS